MRALAPVSYLGEASLEAQSHTTIHPLDNCDIRLEVTSNEYNKYPGP